MYVLVAAVVCLLQINRLTALDQCEKIYDGGGRLYLRCELENLFYATYFTGIRGNILPSQNIAFIQILRSSLNSRLVLDNQLSLEDIHMPKYAQIQLYGFEGIDVDYKDNWLIKNADDLPVSMFYYSKFRSLKQGEPIDSLCDLDTLGQSANHFVGILMVEQGSKYFANTCPHMLAGAHLNSLFLRQSVRSLVIQNSLTFSKLTHRNQTIKEVQFRAIWLYIDRVYMIELNEQLLSKQLFERNVTKLIVQGVLQSAEPYLFSGQSYPGMLTLEFHLDNMRQFVQQNPNLFAHVASSKNVVFIQGSNENFEEGRIPFYYLMDANKYKYPDEDICLFANYSVNSTQMGLLRVILINHFELSKTCTIKWLMQNLLINEYNFNLWERFESFYQVASSYRLTRQLNVTNLTRINHECEFESKFSMCNLTRANELSAPTIYDMSVTIVAVKYVFVVWIQPALSVLGLVCNMFSILTIREVFASSRKVRTVQKTCMDQQKVMYKFLKQNAFFSLLYSLVLISSMLIECVQTNGIFCAAHFFTTWAKHYHVVVIKFIASFLCTCSNLTQCAFTYARYCLNTAGGNDSRFLKTNTNSTLLLFIAFSLMFSVHELFYNETITLTDIHYQVSYLQYAFSRYLVLKGVWLVLALAAYVLNLLFNSLLTLLFTMTVDLMLLAYMRKNFSQKKSAKMTESASQREKAEKNLTKMIVLNGLASCLFKTPLVLISLFGSYHFVYLSLHGMHANRSMWLHAVCYLRFYTLSSFCRNAFDIAQSLSTLCLSLNFILLYKFNNVFKKAFDSKFARKNQF
nr:G protein-coupled receptor [Proales similis]